MQNKNKQPTSLKFIFLHPDSKKEHYKGKGGLTGILLFQWFCWLGPDWGPGLPACASVATSPPPGRRALSHSESEISTFYLKKSE